MFSEILPCFEVAGVYCSLFIYELFC